MNTSPHLQKVKKALGLIHHLDFAALDTVDAHFKLGEIVKPRLHYLLAQKLSALDRAAITRQFEMVNAVRRAVQQKMVSPLLPSEAREALQEYWASLLAWASGGQLHTFNHPSLEGQPASAETLALLLQSETGGCQTGVLRDVDGTAILWHTEEHKERQPGDRFDQIRLFSFSTRDGQHLTAFIYPDLMPGSTFAWGEGAALAVDSLYVKEFSGPSALLANMAAWILLRLNRRPGVERLLSALGPFRDGYAATLVRRAARQVTAEKFEFAGEHLVVSTLPAAANCYLFQVNVFADRQSLAAQTWEQVTASKLAWLEPRPHITRRLLARVRAATDKPYALRQMLASQAGGGAAYANEDVKGHFVCAVTPDQTTAWVGVGPALKGENQLVFTEPGAATVAGRAD